MIVEFIGSTGAGKSTLIEHILAGCGREGIQVVGGTDFVLRQCHLQGVRSRPAQAVFINLIALAAAVAAWRDYHGFYRFVLRMIWGFPQAVPWSERFLLTKNILKRCGIYAMIRRYGAEPRIYLVDEGTLHVAHSLFVHLAGEANRHDLATFANLVPLPHRVVYLRQEEALLVARLLMRGHPRVPHQSAADAAAFVHQAAQVFDELVQNPRIAPHVVVVDGTRLRVESGSDTHPLHTRVAKVVQIGLQRSAAATLDAPTYLSVQEDGPMRREMIRDREMMRSATLVDCLVDAFNREGVDYCHWKSNIDLAQATAGLMDLDLLVARGSLPQAQVLLARLGFKPAVARWGANPPGIRHYYGLDPETQQLIHVHLFSQVLTGESFVKSHRFPFEAMLLENTDCAGHIRVTSKAAELVLFTLRMFIKYGSLLDLLVLRKKTASIREEVNWLQAGSDRAKVLALLRTYCPVIDAPLFAQCVDTLAGHSSLTTRIRLARQVRQRLRVYAKHTALQRAVAYGQLFWAEVQRRGGKKRQNKVLQAGGAVIALIGSDATGKSTLVAESGKWLGSTFAVTVIHSGKPPSSWLTAPINLALGFVRKGADSLRMDQLKHQKSFAHDSNLALHTFRGSSSVLYALRAVVLAWDRRELILKSHRRAAHGEIIVCDRYPSSVSGAMDSPCLVEERHKSGRMVAIYNHLARLEQRLYRQIPPPDLALRLKVSLETALQRNRARSGQDNEGYLAARHRQSQAWQMPGSRVVEIDTEQTLPATIGAVKTAIWESL